MIQSAARTIAIGKYLVALSASFKKYANEDGTKLSKEHGPSGRRKQLHLLYLLNDLFHHNKYHTESSLNYQVLIGNIQLYLLDLLGHAAAYSVDIYASQQRKIQGLLDIWDRSGYYESSYIAKLRGTVTNAATGGYPDTGQGSKGANDAWDDATGDVKKDAPYIMPASHGDPSTPYYDLPAGNMLPHIMPNSATPINPQLVKPLQFVTGPADEGLATAVKAFLQNVESLEDIGFGDEETDIDIDDFGQLVLRDEFTGDILEGEGYYGWSRAFCEKMKRRSDGIGKVSNSVRRDGSVERILSPRKRRRYSDSGSSRSRGRPSSIEPRDGKRQRNGQRSSSRSRSASREGRQFRSLRSHPRSKSRSSSYSPPPPPPPPPPPHPLQIVRQTPSMVNIPPPPEATSQRHQGPAHPAQPGPFPYPFPQAVPPLGPGGFPIAPPRPPNYQGQWPPPPPPMSNPSSSPPLPTGPRIYHNNGPASYLQGTNPNLQGQIPQNVGGWGQGQQEPNGPMGSYPYAGRGRAQPPFNANMQNGRGFGRGGWTR